MANDFRKSQAVAKVVADVEAPLYNSGYLYMYDSTRPDGTTVAFTTQAQIVRLQFGAQAFTTAVLGFPVTITSTTLVAANSTFSSTATWYLCTGNTTTNLLSQDTIGTAGYDLNLNSVQISSGASVSVSSFVINVPTS